MVQCGHLCLNVHVCKCVSMHVGYMSMYDRVRERRRQRESCEKED